jgi:RND family efflux transporter MFP subunit
MEIISKVVALLVIWSVIDCCSGQKEHQNELTRKVKVEQVMQSDSLLMRSWPGIIKEARHVDLGFRVAGPVMQIMVKEGDYVERGRLLARIDPRDYELQLQVAQAQYEQVNSEAERVIELHERESVTDNDYEKAVSGKKMAAVKLSNAEDQLNDTRLTAPFSGYIEKINFFEGEMVDAGMPVISLIDVSHYEVYVDIPVSFYIRKDDFVSFSGSQKTVSDKEYPLILSGWRKKADNKQLYELRFKLDPSADARLSPGMYILVDIVYKSSAAGTLSIPLESVFKNEGETYVWIFHSDKNIVTRRKIESGILLDDGRIAVNRGLNNDDIVVVAGIDELNENQRVEKVDTVSETNAGGLL